MSLLTTRYNIRVAGSNPYLSAVAAPQLRVALLGSNAGPGGTTSAGADVGVDAALVVARARCNAATGGMETEDVVALGQQRGSPTSNAQLLALGARGLSLGTAASGEALRIDTAPDGTSSMYFASPAVSAGGSLSVATDATVLGTVNAARYANLVHIYTSANPFMPASAAGLNVTYITLSNMIGAAVGGLCNLSNAVVSLCNAVPVSPPVYYDTFGMPNSVDMGIIECAAITVIDGGWIDCKSYSNLVQNATADPAADRPPSALCVAKLQNNLTGSPPFVWRDSNGATLATLSTAGVFTPAGGFSNLPPFPIITSHTSDASNIAASAAAVRGLDEQLTALNAVTFVKAVTACNIALACCNVIRATSNAAFSICNTLAATSNYAFAPCNLRATGTLTLLSNFASSSAQQAQLSVGPNGELVAACTALSAPALLNLVPSAADAASLVAAADPQQGLVRAVSAAALAGTDATARWASNASLWASNAGFFSSNAAAFGSNLAVSAADAGAWASNGAAWASNAGVFSSNAARFASNLAPGAAWASNTAGWASNAATSGATAVFASNAAVFGCNAAWWASNAAAFGCNAAWWASNTAAQASNAADWASNAARFGSNSAVWGSNAAQSGCNAAVWASNSAVWGSNAAVWASNAGRFGSNAAVQASNAADWASNAGRFGSNAAVQASNAADWASNAARFGSNAAVQASNAADWASNAGRFGSNAAVQASNAADWASNAGRFGSNAAAFGSNAAAFGCNAAAFASNAVGWASNAGRFGSNAGAFASNGAVFGSNTAVWTSNAAWWASNTAPAASNAAVFGCNTAVWTSNAAWWASNAALAASNAAVFGCNAAVWGCNAGVWGSNTAQAASNAAVWASNAAASGCNAAQFGCNLAASATATALWASNGALSASATARWACNAAVFGCNTAAQASNAADWASNAGLFGSNAAWWASNTARQASNAADWGCNAALAAASTAAWACNAAVWGSNAARAASNAAVWGCNAAAFGSNAAAWASNAGAFSCNAAVWGCNAAAFGSNAAAWGCNAALVADAIARFGCNAAVFGSNTAVQASNAADWASNAGVWGCNAARWASNTAAQASNAADWASNAGVWGSNAGRWASNAGAFGSNTAVHASNAADWGCNAAVWGCNAGAWASNAGLWASNAGRWASNAGWWASNTAWSTSNTAWWTSNAAAWGSNTAAWGCNTAFQASNAADWACNAAVFGSNTAAWGSNAGWWASNTALQASNAADWASNTARQASNAADWASNAAVFGSNAGRFGSNAAAWASNTAQAASNAGFAPALLRSYTASNSGSNLVSVLSAVSASAGAGAALAVSLSNDVGGAVALGIASSGSGGGAYVASAGGADLTLSAAGPGVVGLQATGASGWGVSNAPLEFPPAPGLPSAAAALCNVLYGRGAYGAAASSTSACNAGTLQPHLAFSRCNLLGLQSNVSWSSDGGYTSVNGQAYDARGLAYVPSTTVDGVAYLGQWLQLSLPAPGVLAPTAYSIVPQLSSGSSGVPDGQPKQWVLAGTADPAGAGGWTALDLTYAASSYSPVNASISVSCPAAPAGTYPAAASRTSASPVVVRAVRLIVTAVSVSSSPPPSGIVSVNVAALQLFAQPCASVLAAASSGVAMVGGPLGIGTATPTQRLDVRGTAAFSSNVYVAVQPPYGAYSLQLGRDSAAKPASSTWTVSSDRRIKTDVQPADLQRCYDIVRSVPLSRFRWRDDVYSPDAVPDRSRLGWIAQDVATAFPKAVSASPAFGLDDCLSLNTDQLLAALYGAVQHLAARVEAALL